tara:strand:+ start:19923 stop:21977 length:2055 start_codon:yes stop_codon:yes gene_type:complete
MRLRKVIPIAVISFFVGNTLRSQCSLSVETTSDSIACGDCVTLTAVGEAEVPLLEEDFNNNSLGAGWTANTTLIYNNPCGAPPDGTASAWFGQGSQPRELETTDYDISCGGTICFEMKYAVQGGSGNCEGPDLTDEGVYIQYSTDGGATWVTIDYHDPNGGNDPVLTTWNEYCYSLPAGALTANTRFRWFQDVGSGATYDHWGIDNVVLSGTICGSYYYDWAVDGTTNNADTSVCLSANSETYNVIYTDGASDTCSASITIFSNLDANLPNDTSICGIEDYDITSNPINGSGSYDYLWNTGETTSSAQGVTTGEYYVDIVDQNFPACTATDTMFFEMNPIPDVAFSADPLCQGAFTYFTDETTVPNGYTISSWDWDFDDQGASSSDQNPSHEFSGVGVYNVTLTVDSGNGCIGDTTIIIDIEPSPFANFSFTDACEGEEVFFDNESLGNYENSQWIFETAENDTVVQTDASFTFPGSGSYDVTLIIEKSDGACSDTLTESITVNPGPNVIFSSNVQVGEPPLVVDFYNQSTGASSYLWDFMNGNTSNSLNDTVTETFTEPGDYPVTLYGTSAAGCEGSYTLVITVEFEDLVIQVPNIFTPNGDNTNDDFYLNYLQAKQTIENFEIVILNRWGNVVRTFNDPDFKWDGTTEGGKYVNDGTYFYKVNITTIKGQEVEEHGAVQVER